MVFEGKKFFVSYLVWLIGLGVSLLPIFVDFIIDVSGSKAALADFDAYFYCSSEMLYGLVSAIFVAFSDIVVEFIIDKKRSVFKGILLLFQALILLLIVFGYSLDMYSNSISDEVMYVIGRILFWFCYIICTITCLSKNLTVRER